MQDNTTGRIIALDYGKKRTGIAVTDPLRIIANPLETVPTSEIIPFLKKYTESNPVGIIVVGYPRQADGSDSETVRFIKPFAQRIAREFPGISVEFYDERMTTVLAHRAILESGLGRMKRRDKGLADKVSAAIILRDYMESKNSGF